MQRRTTLGAACALLAASALTWGVAAQAQQPGAAPRIAVTNLAYAQQVSEYFVAGTYQESSQMSAQGSYSSGHSHGMYGGSGSASGQQSMQASAQASGTYVAGRYSYIEQRDLAGYTNDIKGAILQGTYFKLVQGKAFDAGAPQPSKAEQVLNQVSFMHVQALADDFLDRHARRQRRERILEHHLHLTAQLLVGARVAHGGLLPGLPGHLQRARAGQQAQDGLRQRGLARARLPHHAQRTPG